MRLVCLPLLLLIACLGGCAERLPPLNDKVEGVVRYEGTPLVGVRVEFVPDTGNKSKAPSSSAITDGKGRFALACENSKPGALIARHRVVVLQGRGAGARDDPDAPVVARGFRLPTVYSMANQTPLRITVTSDQHTYDLNLTTNPTPVP